MLFNHNLMINSLLIVHHIFDIHISEYFVYMMSNIINNKSKRGNLLFLTLFFEM